MAHVERNTIKITPKLIELTDQFVAVKEIATVYIGRDPIRLRLQVILFLIFALPLFGAFCGMLFSAANMAMQFGMSIVDTGLGTPILVFGGLFALVSLVILLLGRVLLVISSSDGKNTVIYSRNRRFLTPILERIREVILAGEDGKVIYQVNIVAEKIDRIDASETSIVNSPGAMAVGGDMVGSSIDTDIAVGNRDAVRRAPANAFSGFNEAARQRLKPLARRAQDAAAVVQQQVGQVRQAAVAAAGSYRSASGGEISPSLRVDRSPGAVAVGGNMVGSTVSTKVKVVNDFDAIVELLKANRIDYLEEIVDYLEPVRDHLAGGATKRPEALERWAWFAAQAAGALSGIDGLLGLVERIGRALGR